MAVKIILQLSLKQLQFLLLLLFLLSISATSLTFNFPGFYPSNASKIDFEGDASADGSLRLTKSARDTALNMSVGRATFCESFLLRQNSTGKLADFTSTFTFVIDSNNQTSYGDGMVFFLAPAGSELNKTLGAGNSLGLPVNSSLANFTMSSTQYEFVAIEFDIFCFGVESMDWGLSYPHMGIDINSVKSNITEAWSGGIMEGKQNNATISYNSSSKNLGVAFTTFANGVNGSEVQMMRNISFIVNLLQYLPDRVIVGFSASTGELFALHKIISWNFTSTPLD
ncbi:hypothetical protein M0R45_014772 [Rubus argutus]|uniref:Legume lectin domain-containing protein n=1 Tax=Rubus argutus TaxID=59490 RepID=A0AAW1XPW8_RUBAR